MGETRRRRGLVDFDPGEAVRLLREATSLVHWVPSPCAYPLSGFTAGCEFRLCCNERWLPICERRGIDIALYPPTYVTACRPPLRPSRSASDFAILAWVSCLTDTTGAALGCLMVMADGCQHRRLPNVSPGMGGLPPSNRWMREIWTTSSCWAHYAAEDMRVTWVSWAGKAWAATSTTTCAVPGMRFEQWRTAMRHILTGR